MGFLISGTMVRDTTIPNGSGAYVVKPIQLIGDNQGVSAPNSSLVYFVDNNTRFEVWSMLLVSPWTLTQIGIDNMFATAPYGVAISPDNSTLYIVCDGGSVYSLPSNATTNAAVLLGTLNGTDTFTTSWRICWLDPGDPTALIVINVAGRKVYGFNLLTGAVSYLFQYWGSFVSTGGVAANDPNSIYPVLAPSGAGAQNLVIRQYRGLYNSRQGGAHEVAAGNLVNGNTSGVAQQSQLAATKAVAVDYDGNLYCYTSTPKIRSVSAGQLADVTISGGTLGSNPGGATWQRNTNSASGGYLLVAGGNNHIQVIA